VDQRGDVAEAAAATAADNNTVQGQVVVVGSGTCRILPFLALDIAVDNNSVALVAVAAVVEHNNTIAAAAAAAVAAFAALPKLGGIAAVEPFGPRVP